MAQAPDVIAARRFLKRGLTGSLPDEALAQACDRLVQQAAQKSYARGAELARRFAARARGHSRYMRAVAVRALARWSHMSGRHREALNAYRQARRLLASDRLARARIDRALTDVHMYLGDFAAARRSASLATRTFRSLGADSDLAQARVNLANVLHRQDRHREAEQLYSEASAYFTTSGNVVAAARTDYNWANTLVQRFALDEAESLYGKSVDTYLAAGLELDACDAQYGLAWLRMLRGDFHPALEDLARCEATYRKGGDPRGEALCSLDRAEVYLHLVLYQEALETARCAERRFRNLKLRYEAAKAALFRGQAALAVGLRPEARAALARASGAFAQEKNIAFLGVCSLLDVDLRGPASTEGSRALRRARSAFSRTDLPFWQAVCDLRVPESHSRASLDRLSHNPAVRVVPHLYALWQTWQGDLLYTDGRRQQARECWRKAADRIDGVRAQLPPLGVRNPYGAAHSLPHQRLIDYELARRPLIAAAWSERRKTAGLWAPVAGQPLDRTRRRVSDSLDKLARQVAAFSSQAGLGIGARGVTASSRRQAKHLERWIRQEFAHLDSGDSTLVESEASLASQIRRLSRRLSIIQIHLSANDIIVFVHERGGTRVVTYPDGRKHLASLLERLRFLIEGELLPDYPGVQLRLKAEETLWREFGDWFWLPLQMKDISEVLVVPEGETANIPWQALTVGGQPLGDCCRFLVAPSVRHVLAAERRRAQAQTVRVFRGASDNLPQVDRELRTLHDLFGNTVESYSPGRRADWPDADRAAIWHFSGHAHMNSENPFYSYLLMSDGPLFAADFRLRQCTVDLVTLAACRSGEQSAIPGEEATGLVRSLLEMGARCVVAPHWPVADAPAAAWMSAFYTCYVDSKDVLTAARHAARTVRQSFPSACHWAAFSVFGAGGLGGSHAN